MERRAQGWLIVALLVAAGISAGARAWQLNPYYLGVLVDVGINVVLAVSLNLINGHTGQFSLGHAGFMAVGGYTAASVSLGLAQHWDPAMVSGAGLVVALLAGGLAAAVAGLAVGIPSLRLKGDYLAIVTLGFGEIIRVLIQNTEAVGGASGLKGIPKATTFFWAWGMAAITVYTVGCVVQSTYGRGFIAVHDDEVAARSMGINTTRYKVTAFVLGAFFAGLAGGLFAHHKQFLTPSGFDFNKSIEIVVMVILGGMGRTGGVIAAAVLLTLLPEFLRPIQGYRMILYALLIIGLMLLRPQGLFNFSRSRERRA
jgi:branched-chain amino acid transport system permease protein